MRKDIQPGDEGGSDKDSGVKGNVNGMRAVSDSRVILEFDRAPMV